MRNQKIYIHTILLFFTLVGFVSCVPDIARNTPSQNVPQQFLSENKDSTDIVANKGWKDFFHDPYLIALIDTALKNNQELNIFMQEMAVAKNEIKARKGEYLPFVGLRAGAGTEKAGEYTRDGAVDKNLDIKEEAPIPTPLSDYILAANISWEADIWKKLRNAKKAALYRYLATVEGQRFLVTNIVAEIATSYYELMALDKKMETINGNIEIQTNALRIVRLQKQAGTVTELAVKKFEAEVLKNKSLLYTVKQEIIQTENKINFLVGRYPTSVQRDSEQFLMLTIDSIQTGLPSQLITNRPDVRQAELELEAANIDVRSARANFYPSLRITSNIGFQAFNPRFLLSTPESIIYNIAGELVSPLVNRNAIKANYSNANARQVSAIYNYYKTILGAYTEVINNLNKSENLNESFTLKSQQVATLNESISISNMLFRSARADYMEVLMTQRDALDAKIELLETKQLQMSTMINTYKSLGGGWK